MVEAACPIPIPAPAEIDALEDVPLRVNPAPPAGVGPMIVMVGLVDSWLNVMLFPATNPKAVDEAVLAVPEVVPPAMLEIDTNVE